MTNALITKEEFWDLFEKHFLKKTPSLHFAIRYLVEEDFIRDYLDKNPTHDMIGDDDIYDAFGSVHSLARLFCQNSCIGKQELYDTIKKRYYYLQADILLSFIGLHKEKMSQKKYYNISTRVKQSKLNFHDLNNDVQNDNFINDIVKITEEIRDIIKNHDNNIEKILQWIISIGVFIFGTLNYNDFYDLSLSGGIITHSILVSSIIFFILLFHKLSGCFVNRIFCLYYRFFKK